MKSHCQLSDRQLTAEFSKATLDPALFNHEAHLRMAWIHIKTSGVETAVKDISKQLKQYTEVLGFQEKYHETVTVAAIRAVNHFMSKSTSDCFKGFIGQFPPLKTNFKGLLEQHYHKDVFSSPEARIRYLEPEILPF